MTDREIGELWRSLRSDKPPYHNHTTGPKVCPRCDVTSDLTLKNLIRKLVEERSLRRGGVGYNNDDAKDSLNDFGIDLEEYEKWRKSSG